MGSSGDTYRQYIPELALSIEKNTERVPKDGKYYLLRNGQILRAFKSLKKAQAAFGEMVAQAGYVPKPRETRAKSAAEQNVETYLDAVEMYWAQSYKHRQGGGKGGRGGV